MRVSFRTCSSAASATTESALIRTPQHDLSQLSFASLFIFSTPHGRTVFSIESCGYCITFNLFHLPGHMIITTTELTMWRYSKNLTDAVADASPSFGITFRVGPVGIPLCAFFCKLSAAGKASRSPQRPQMRLRPGPSRYREKNKEGGVEEGRSTARRKRSCLTGQRSTTSSIRAACEGRWSCAATWAASSIAWPPRRPKRSTACLGPRAGTWEPLAG